MIYSLEGMPILQEYSDAIGQNYFKGIYILYINHLISDSLMVARAFKKTGAKIWIVGIPYGDVNGVERKNVINGLKELGYVTVPKIKNPLEFSPSMRRAVKKTLLLISASCIQKRKKFMIVEDGGYAFPLLHDDPQLKPLLKYCIGATEHTARGMWNYQYLETDGIVKTPRVLNKPAVTVANSSLKEKHEPFFVAQAIVDEMGYLLRKKHQFYSYKHITVLGAGRVGKGIAIILNRMNAYVTVIDHNNKNLQLLKKIDAQIGIENKLSDKVLSNTAIIIGATGTPSLLKNHLISFLKNNNTDLILVSASSKEIEFKEIMIAMEEFIKNPSQLNQTVGIKGSIFKKIKPEFGIEYQIKLTNGLVKTLTVLADGYPVIFFPNVTHGAPNRAMDPIMSELYLAACLLKNIANKLNNKIYTLSDLNNIQLPKGPWTNLVDEFQILKKWSLYNNIELKSYCHAIGYGVY